MSRTQTRLSAKQSKLRMNARLTRERDRARASELRRLLLCGAAIVIPLLGYVWQRVEFIRTSYHIGDLAQQRQELREFNKQMTIERAMLLSPRRIEEVARRQLGLVDPPPENVRHVKMLDGRLDPEDGSVAGRTIDRGHGGVLAAGLGPLRRTASPGEQR
jgi:cell division protein FtsL